MKKKIKEVQDYFKNKIVNGDYEVIKNEYHTMDIVIDSEYHFTLWMANDGYSFETYSGKSNTMQLEFDESERAEGYGTAKVIHDKYKRTELLEKKRAELEALENELDES